VNPDRLAKEIFGKPARLDLARWILAQPPGRFFPLGEVVDALPRWEASTVHSCLKQMVSHGLLGQVSPVRGRVQYRRTHSPLWQGYAGFVEGFARLQRQATGDAAPAGGLARVSDLPVAAEPPHHVSSQPPRDTARLDARSDHA